MKFLSTLLLFFSSALATSALAITIDILYDGRAYPGFDANLLDDSSGPYLTYAISLFSRQGTYLIWVCAQRRQGT